MDIKDNITLIVLIIVFLFVLLLKVWNCSQENYRKLRDEDTNMRLCTFVPDCLWDTARWVTLPDGSEGVCTLNGIACPAFSKDHYSESRRGKSLQMIENEMPCKLQLPNESMFPTQ